VETSDCRARLATPDDAPAIAGLVRAEYGTAYADARFLDPAALAAALASGDLVYAVAECPRDGHVAQVALERQNRHGLWEHGRAVVAPGHRGRGLFARLDELLLPALERRGDARAVLGRAVTHHDRTQRHMLGLGWTALGLLVSTFPSPRGGPPGSALMIGRLLEERPRRLALSGPALRFARGRLDALGLPSVRSPGEAGPFAASIERQPRIGLVHVRLGRAVDGEEPAGAALAAVDPHAAAPLLWVDVPVEQAGAAAAVDALQEQGFALGAYLPLAGPDGQDVLRLQRAALAPTPDGLQLVPPWRPLALGLLAGVHAAAAAEVAA
jgi:hypothetical protein